MCFKPYASFLDRQVLIKNEKKRQDWQFSYWDKNVLHAEIVILVSPSANSANEKPRDSPLSYQDTDVAHVELVVVGPPSSHQKTKERQNR